MPIKEAFNQNLDNILEKLRNLDSDYFRLYYDLETKNFEVSNEYTGQEENTLTIECGATEKLPESKEELTQQLIKNIDELEEKLKVLKSDLKNFTTEHLNDILKEQKETKDYEFEFLTFEVNSRGELKFYFSHLLTYNYGFKVLRIKNEIFQVRKLKEKRAIILNSVNEFLKKIDELENKRK